MRTRKQIKTELGKVRYKISLYLRGPLPSGEHSQDAFNYELDSLIAKELELDNELKEATFGLNNDN